MTKVLERWYRDRNDRLAWNPERDAMRTQLVARRHTWDWEEQPVLPGKWTAALFGPHDAFQALNVSAESEYELLEAVEAGFGPVEETGHQEYALAGTRWYVYTYFTPAVGVAA